MSYDSSITAGLESALMLKIGCRVIVRRNNSELNISNGDIGRVMSVKRQVPFIMSTVETELPRKEENGRRLILTPVQVSFPFINKVYVERLQFLITLAYGISIHKSQTLSVDEAIIDTGQSIFSSGQMYVALSRVRTLNGVHLINFDPASIKVDPRSTAEYNCLQKIIGHDAIKII